MAGYDEHYCAWQVVFCAMHFRTTGTGPSLVLLHGFCEDNRVWSGIASGLERDYTVIMPDLPGFGRTAGGEDNLEDWARRIDSEVVSRNCPEGAVFIGHSMGGYVALAYAELFPDKVKGLGLFHSTCSPDNDERKEGRLKNIRFVKEHGPVPFVKQLIPTLFAEGADKGLIERAMNIGLECSAEGIVLALEAMRIRPGRCGLLKKAGFPVLIIAGEKDTLIPAGSLSEIASYPDRCLFRLLKNSGHMGLLEETEESVNTIREFMELV